MRDSKILLCADLHLGRASAWMQGPETTDRTAVGAWRRLVRQAIEGGACAVAIAGDVFDGLAAYYETRSAFLDGLRTLKAAGVAVVAVAGNHDHEALPRFARRFHDSGLTLLGEGGRWESFEVGGITFVGWSFPAETVRTRAFDAFVPPAVEGPVVGVVHGDAAPKTVYHPFRLEDVAHGADAWVLGHIHKPARFGPRAVYPGSPQALDFGPGERGAHGFYWLSFVNGRAEFSALQPLSTVRFEEASLSVEVSAGEEGWEAVLRATEAHSDALREAHPFLESVQLRARVVVSGCEALPKVSPEAEPSRDGRDAVLFTEARLRPVRDLWLEGRGRDATGEIARLLLGATARGGRVDGREVDPEWIRLADDLVARCAGDVGIAFRATIGGVQDAGDAARPAPDEAEAREIARAALVAELEDLLGQTEARREAVAA